VDLYTRIQRENILKSLRDGFEMCLIVFFKKIIFLFKIIFFTFLKKQPITNFQKPLKPIFPVLIRPWSQTPSHSSLSHRQNCLATPSMFGLFSFHQFHVSVCVSLLASYHFGSEAVPVVMSLKKLIIFYVLL
jgi:hypothetical protein